MNKILILILICFCSNNLFSQSKSDAILGKWASEKGNLVLEIYKTNNSEYKAKSIQHNSKNPKDEWKDINNPDPDLRNRNLLGIDVLTQMHYDPDSDKWVDGIIYDATSGKSWEAVAWLDNPNQLRVKGFWMLKLFSKTVSFKRVK